MARIVLVADDSPTIQKKAVGILKGEGFEVETVSNGVAAIKRLALIHPVVILADVSMPGRDGYEVCEFVKKSAQLSHVPVLLVASEMEPYDDARGAEVRADGIIKKPFEAHDLISIVVRFAEQCEAESPTIAAAAVEPPATPEFVVSSGESDYAPTVVQQVTPDIPAVSEEAAFAEPAREEAPGYYPEAQPAEAEAPYVAPQPEAEIPLEFAPAPEFVRHISCSRSAQCSCRGNSLGRGGGACSQSRGATTPSSSRRGASSIVCRRVRSRDTGTGVY